MNKHVFGGLIAILILNFLFLRWYRYQHWATCSTDQGMHLLDTYRMWQEKDISLLGPPSSYAANGRMFFFGPASYYIALPFLVILGFKQSSVAVGLVLFQLLSVLFVATVLIKYKKQPLEAIMYIALFSFFPWAVHYSRFFWNPNFGLPAAGFLVGLLLLLDSKQYNSTWLTFMIGLVWGIGLQFHYNFILAMGVSGVYLLFVLRDKLKAWGFVLVGFLLGLGPLLLFELRNQFYNLKTIGLYLTKVVQGEIQATVATQGPPPYYWFPLVPLLIWLAVRSRKFFGHYRFVYDWCLLIGVMLWLGNSLPKANNGYLMPQDWQCHDFITMQAIIESQNPSDFNIVDMLTGDTRAMYLRALLTISGTPPLGLAEYPQAEKLFVYSRLSPQQIKQAGLWEVSVLDDFKVGQRWQIKDEVWLYRLERPNSGIKNLGIIKLLSP